ncbi:Phosphate acetyltransferase, partial [human gut metagenome]
IDFDRFAASGFPNLAALVLNGGFEPAPYVLQLLKGLDQPIPVLTTALDTFEAAKVAGAVTGSLAHASDRKIDLAVTAFEQEAD